jgi:hypothetical protein
VVNIWTPIPVNIWTPIDTLIAQIVYERQLASPLESTAVKRSGSLRATATGPCRWICQARNLAGVAARPFGRQSSFIPGTP